MLRLPPSLITISVVELQDFCLRQKAKLLAAQPNRVSQTGLTQNQSFGSKKLNQSQAARVASENQVVDNEARREPSDFQYGNSSSDAVDSSLNVHHLPDEQADAVDLRLQDASQYLDVRGYDGRTHSRTGSQRSAISGPSARTGNSRRAHDFVDPEVEGRPCSDDGQSLNSDSYTDQENESEFLPVSQDSTGDIDDFAGKRGQQSHNALSSPSKHRFDYGGFVESPPHDSSSFMPEDTSTTAPLAQNDVHRLRARLPLPRSPLHISELVTKSPERREADLPALRVASYEIPTLLLSRRPKRTPKAYRPRTISYSYDESERTSAVYEEPQPNASDNDDSQLNPQLRHQVSLHEELRGSSLHSASERSEDPPSSPPGATIIHNDETNQTMYFSSPQLPGDLPPPFSTVPRSTSVVSVLSDRSDESVVLVDDSPSPRRRRKAPEISSPANHRSSGALQRIGRMFSSKYRERSPMSSPESSPVADSSPTTPRQSVENPNSSSQSFVVTPRRSVRVYDDSLPPSSQPQTPAHLPESRHRSRLHPSYTAPVTRHGRRAFHASPRSSARVTGSANRSRRPAGRSDSPLGMGGERGEGFRGLYGGQENVDDDSLFDNAARRLWDTGRARSAERRGSDGTPEREMTIADIRRQYHE